MYATELAVIAYGSLTYGVCLFSATAILLIAWRLYSTQPGIRYWSIGMLANAVGFMVFYLAISMKWAEIEILQSVLTAIGVTSFFLGTRRALLLPRFHPRFILLMNVPFLAGLLAIMVAFEDINLLDFPEQALIRTYYFAAVVLAHSIFFFSWSALSVFQHARTDRMDFLFHGCVHCCLGVLCFVALLVVFLSDFSINSVGLFAYQALFPALSAGLLLLTASILMIHSGNLHKEVLQQATTDSLTGLFNRRGFELNFHNIARMANRNRRDFTLGIVDIDHFKKVNDTFGHDAGDEVLCKVAQTIDQMRRDSDLLARFGGEEFILVFPETDLAEARTVSERLRQMVESLTIEFQDSSISVTVSIGLASSRQGETFEALFSTADQALYRAKEAGRNRIVTNTGTIP